MDQVRVVLKVTRKHHFWILCGVVMVVALVLFYIASGRLAASFDEGKQRLENAAKAAEQIGTDTPNEKVIAAIQADINTARGDVFAAWEYLYNLQKQKNPWPVKDLGEEFCTVIRELDKSGPNKEIPRPYREHYRAFIRNHFSKIWEIVDVQHKAWVSDNDGTTVLKKEYPFKANPWDMSEPVTEPYKVETQGIVIWTNPGDILKLGSSWNNALPSSRAVRLAQEDLWVYQALLRIIAATNEGASGPHNAAIKQIDAINIGPAAAAAFASATLETAAGMAGQLRSAAASTGASGDEYGDEYMEVESGDGADAGMAGGYFPTEGLGEDDALLQGRYVDKDGNPLSATNRPFAEFNMLPIQMRLVIDQRKIPEFLANCANSSMPVEVRQMSISTGTGGSLNVGAMAGSYGGDEYGEGGGRFGGAIARPAQSTAVAVAESPVDVPIEVQGIIYIFNKPDATLLATGTEGEESEEAPLVPQRAPTVTPAALPDETTDNATPAAAPAGGDGNNTGEPRGAAAPGP